MVKVKDLQVGMKVVNAKGTEFKVTDRQGRKWVSLERLSDGRIRFYDNESLMDEKVEVVK
ncbi:hypothetical protein [Streptococcus phage Dp-1]|uniref:hypothetical protein n=1 Tax=Pneumococcus phage Dp-1 TaxID=59241 RepID=UPI0001F3E62F|nr:hypothetical protein StPhDp-1_gp30 [Streptococcus phage Dp-1]ADT64037.1 hypothetical protein [Streptococcus phage Dp-1]